jgi:peptidoglycan/LPS O-acetylase OafA/YrhL
VTERNAALDGVRGIALLLVFACHARPDFLIGGGIGVDLFFVLSGFLITSILLREFDATGKISLARFYARRALRLFPALFLFVAVTIVSVAIFDPASLGIVLGNSLSVVFYCFNWLRNAALPTSIGIYPHFGHLWSLSVEEQFYLAWPLVMIAALRSRNANWQFSAVIVAGILAPAIARLILYRHEFLWGYFRTDLRFDMLMWGAGAAWLIARVNFERVAGAFSWAGMVALATLIAMAKFNLFATGFLTLGGYTLVGLVSAILIIAGARATSGLVSRILQAGALRYTGKISYGLYIVHVPVFNMIYHAISIPELAQTAIAIAICYAIAGASFRYWETPFLALKERFESQPAQEEHDAILATESGTP